MNNIMTYGLDYDEDDTAEKVGNYVPYIKLGSQLASILKIKDVEKEKIKDKEYKKLWEEIVENGKISKHLKLTDRTAEDICSTLFESFHVGAVEYIKEELKDNDQVMIEFSNFYTIEAEKEDDKISVLITAAPISKLDIRGLS